VAADPAVPAVTAAPWESLRRSWRQGLDWTAPFAGIAAFLGVWEAGVVAFGVPEFQLPRPSRVIRRIASDPTSYLRDAWPSVRAMVLGLALAASVAFILAVAAQGSRYVERALAPLVVQLIVTPLYSYASAVVIWVGFGLRPILILTAIVCFAPLYANAVAGLRSADPAAVDVLHSVGASSWEVLRRIRIPSALPSVFAGLKVAVGLSLVGVTLAEPAALQTVGLGSRIRQESALNGIDGLSVWATIFVVGFVGSLAYVLVSIAERRLLRWSRTHR
jgi:NitT/TauT family transport system permease protein